MKLAISILILAIATSSCHQEENLEPIFLFEKDGCKVYKFRDRGHYVYWTNCNGQVVSELITQTTHGSYSNKITSQTISD